MKSTGEVMGVGRSFGEAFSKAQAGAGVDLPTRGQAFISVRERDKDAAVEIASQLHDLGFDLLATGGTSEAACRLVENLGGDVVQISFIIELTFLNGREKMPKYDIKSLITYDSED